MNNYCVYYHKSPSGKMYIGQTNDYKRRCSSHKNTTNKTTLFSKAVKKYGWDNFEHKIIADNLSIEESNELEEFLIEECNTLTPNGYNIRTGGANYVFSDSHKQMLSITRKQYAQQLTELERKQKYGAHNKGRTHPNYMPDGWVSPMKGKIGKPCSEDKKLKQKITMIGNTRQTRHKVSINGVEYSSVFEAARELNIGHNALRYRLQTKQEGYKYLHNINNLEKE